MVTASPEMWIGVSLCYMFAAIYFQVRYKDILPISVPLAYFTFGAGIFFIVNTTPGSIPFLDPDVAEYLAAIVLLLAWTFGFSSVRTYVKTVSGLGNTDSE